MIVMRRGIPDEGLGQMTLVIHALVEDAHNINSVGKEAVKQDMRARRILVIARPHLGTWPANGRT